MELRERFTQNRCHFLAARPNIGQREKDGLGWSVPMRVLDDVLAAEGEDAVAGVIAEGAALLEDGLPAGEERLPARVDDGQVALLVADDRLQVVALPAARGVRRGEEAAEGARELVLRGLAEALVVDANPVEVAAPGRV